MDSKRLQEVIVIGLGLLILLVWIGLEIYWWGGS